MFSRLWAWIKGLNTSKSPRRVFGKVKYFHRQKGFGFIKSYVVDEDIFVHASELESPIRKGRVISFQLEENPKGYIAKNVQLTYA